MVLNKFVYSESQATFFKDVTNGMFLDKMREAAKDCDLRVSDSELISWKNNASKVMELLQESDLNDAYVAFECMLPYTRLRVDCMLFGRDALNQGNVVHVELKQWSNRRVKATDCSANFRVDEISKEEDRVQAYIGGEEQLVAHPSQQVRGYNDYLMGFIEILSNEKVKVKGVAYCYNYSRNISPNVLYDEKYTVLQEKYRTYAQEEMGNLASYLHEALGNGGGRAVFNEFVNSPIHPSKKLIESAASLIHEGNESEFALVGEQIIARNVILDVIRKKKQKKTVVIVRGGPGTGKTVIALHVFSLLSKKVNDSNRRNHIRYVTKSKSLLEGVRDQLPDNRITKVLFSNILCLHPSRCEQNSIDVLLIDEAQRLSEDANIPSIPINKRTELAQIDTVLRASKISVFFIDDKQVIRGLDVGSSELIRTCAQKYGADIEEIEFIGNQKSII